MADSSTTAAKAPHKAKPKLSQPQTKAEAAMPAAIPAQPQAQVEKKAVAAPKKAETAAAKTS
jgi:hypothetical protein